MTTWSYFTSRLVSGQVLYDLPLAQVQVSHKLGGTGIGELTGQLALSEHAADRLANTEPWLCALWVADGDQLRWGGPLVARPYDSGSGFVQVKAAEPGAYYARRRLRRDLTFAQVDQLAIQRALYASAETEPGGSIGLQLGAETSGVLRDRTYLAAEAKWVEEAAKQLSDVQGGFDYRWAAAWVGRTPRPVLLQGYPYLAAAAPVVMEYPGDVLGYSFPEEGAAMATSSLAIGKKDDVTGLTTQAAATSTDLLAAGYPLLDQVNSYTDVSDDDTLQGHADADLAAAAGPVAAVVVRLRLDDLLASGLEVGNVVRLRITDERFPDGHDEQYRAVTISYAPQEGGASVELAPRVLVGGRLPSRATAAGLLANIARRLLRVETV